MLASKKRNVLARTLGLVHGQIGVLSKGIDLGAVAWRDNNAERRGDHHVQLLQRESLLQQLYDAGKSPR